MEQNNLSALETFYKYIEEVFVLSGIHGFVTAVLGYIQGNWQRGGLIAGSVSDSCNPFWISPVIRNQDESRVTEIVSEYSHPGRNLVAMLVKRTVTKEIDSVSFILGFLAAVVLVIAYILIRMAIQKICDKIKGKARDFINSCIRSHRANVLAQYAVEKGDQQDL